MEKKYMERLVGKYCKIVTKEPGEERASVVSGILEEVDYKDGFIMVNSKQGLGCLRINTIVAIKPGRILETNNGKHKKSLKDDKKGMIGIGTLIIFIAMVLVAAVAASVLIQTSQTLQQRAYKVSSETIQEVSSGLRIDDISGYTNVNRTNIELMAMIIAPRAGSQYIDLQNVVVTIQLDNYTVLGFDPNLIAGNVSSDGVFHTLNNTDLNSTNYGIIVIHDADNSIVGTYGMNVGDSAFIVMNLSASAKNGGAEPRKDLQGAVIPEIGMSAVYYVRTPAVFEQRIIQLY
jgi:flagellin FlaB